MAQLDLWLSRLFVVEKWIPNSFSRAVLFEEWKYCGWVGKYVFITWVGWMEESVDGDEDVLVRVRLIT